MARPTSMLKTLAHRARLSYADPAHTRKPRGRRSSSSDHRAIITWDRGRSTARRGAGWCRESHGRLLRPRSARRRAWRRPPMPAKQVGQRPTAVAFVQSHNRLQLDVPGRARTHRRRSRTARRSGRRRARDIVPSAQSAASAAPHDKFAAVGALVVSQLAKIRSRTVSWLLRDPAVTSRSAGLASAADGLRRGGGQVAADHERACGPCTTGRAAIGARRGIRRQSRSSPRSARRPMWPSGSMSASAQWPVVWNGAQRARRANCW